MSLPLHLKESIVSALPCAKVFDFWLQPSQWGSLQLLTISPITHKCVFSRWSNWNLQHDPIASSFASSRALSLRELWLGDTSIAGCLFHFFSETYLSLTHLSLQTSSITGMIPMLLIWKASSLLGQESGHLKGTISSKLGRLMHLQWLSMGWNSLDGWWDLIILDWFFGESWMAWHSLHVTWCWTWVVLLICRKSHMHFESYLIWD